MRKVTINLTTTSPAWLRRGGPVLALALLLSLPALAAPRPRQWVKVDTALAPPLPADAAAQPPLRRPAAGRLAELRSQRDFQYVEGKPTGPGWWDRVLAWFWRHLGGALDTRGGRVAWDTLLYGLMGAILVFAVLKLLQVDLTKVFGRAPRSLPLAYEAGQENIHELNFTDALT
ncbi:MAG: hypothetical protein EOO56_25110, partial [Hymenobacter sp.]